MSLIAAGTELGLAVDAAKELENDGKKIRVVSMVSWELFEEQDQQYRVTHFLDCLVLVHGCMPEVVISLIVGLGSHAFKRCT